MIENALRACWAICDVRWSATLRPACCDLVGNKWNSWFACFTVATAESWAHPTLSTWEQPLALLCSCQKVFFCSQEQGQHSCTGPWESHPASDITVYSRSFNAPHNTFSWLALKDGCRQYWVSGSLGRRAACEISELGSLDSCECVIAPECISFVKCSVQMNSQSIIGTGQQPRSLKALTSCHIQAQISVFTVSQIQSESLQQGREPCQRSYIIPTRLC